jgi:hypothetical protein
MDDNLMWFKSTFSSGNGQCIECAHLPEPAGCEPRSTGVPYWYRTGLGSCGTYRQGKPAAAEGTLR